MTPQHRPVATAWAPGEERESERATPVKRERVFMSRVNSLAAVCHHGPVTGPVPRWSCFHGPVYRCYETALGAGAVGQTGFMELPQASVRLLHRNKLSLPRWTRGHSRGSCPHRCHFCPRARHPRTNLFTGRISTCTSLLSPLGNLRIQVFKMDFILKTNLEGG